ncbi:receptor-type tyrosine-protein phosphatase beta-like [Dendropsophus ebraccatus]|uniref:receptor-type tyrosine-protein phosphatase beta-like n=1 Tax=Dendropsophus ebraccatus TaxID=150705 RepID=UPI0038313A77
MSGVNKSYNISYGIFSSSNITVTSSTTNVTTLQNLISGTNYSISVVTVGVRGYGSSPLTTSVYTKPMPIKSLSYTNVTSSSVSLTWSKPDEYQTSYSYRVQTNVSSSSNTTVRTESATISGLTPGETYTFMVYTRAADGLTESDPVSLSTCTVPAQVSSVSLINSQLIDTLRVTWTKPTDGKVDYYNVSITGAVSNTIQTTTTQVTVPGLLPGREYSVTVQTVSGSCSQTSAPVTEATYPTSPGNIIFTTITPKTLTFSWMEPVNMSGVNKSYNISYGIFSSSNITVTSSTTNVTTLQNLISGTNYSISVVTVGVRGYGSSPLTTSVYTSPGQISISSVNNYKSTSFLVVDWTNATGKVDNYNVTLTGVISKTTNTNSNSLRANFTDLTPGAEYTATVQIVSGNCSVTSAPMSEATYPTPPGNIIINQIGTNTLILSWGPPVYMSSVSKSYNTSYGTSSGPWTIKSNTENGTTLQNLTSGTNYSISVVTVAARGYGSSPVTTSVYTKPLSVKSPQISNVMSSSVSLTWSKPDEYQTSYRYRVQTNVSSSSSLINNTIVTKPMSIKSLSYTNVTPSSVSLTWSKPDEYQTSYSYRVQTNVSSSSSLISNTVVTSESATISGLTPGETYTFMVYTRAADGLTESDPVSLSTCTGPGQISISSVNNYKSTSFLVVDWTNATGKVDNYNVTLTGVISKTTNTNSNSLRANFTDLTPGAEYTATVQIVSGNCSVTSAPMSEATYPTPPGNIIINQIGTNTLTLSWGPPVYMNSVSKSYNTSYGTSSGPWTIKSNTENVTTLQNLTSGTNYSISVVTVAARGYGSSPVTTSVYTKPLSVKSPQISNVMSSSVSLTWSKPDEYQTSYSYRVQTNVSSSSSLINNTIVTNESATISGLTPGETYTFMVYTRAADGLTESDPVSLSTCTGPGQISISSVNNYKSTSFLVADWTNATGKVDYYNVTLTGVISKTTNTNSLRANFTDLTPGAEYTATVQIVSGNCSVTSAPMSEATYPTPPGNIIINQIGTNTLTLSWGPPVYMNSVSKSYNTSYGTSSGPWTRKSNTENVTTLQYLTSGTNYSISVVTVAARGYGSSPVTTSVYTKPMPIKSLIYTIVTPSSVSLTWSKPDEYQTSYSYRVQTNVSSSSSVINNTIVTDNSTTIMNLTPGDTYTFMVYTRAADGLTESDPVSLSTCTLPAQVSSVSLNNYQSVDTLGVTWTKSGGKVGYYNMSLTGAVSNITLTSTTQVTVPGLLPGREYSVTVQTVSGSCSQTSAPVTEATYPTSPGNIIFTTITPKTLTFSWMEPVNMSGVNKSYNISYGIFSSSNTTVTGSTTNVTTLQNLISGTNYSISVVTVGVRGYGSSPLTTSVYTRDTEEKEPMSIKSLSYTNVSSSSVSLTWSKPDEYQTSYSYRVQTNVSSSSNTTVTTESATISGLTPGETYTFMVYTRAADGLTESDPVSLSTCTVPENAVNVSLNNSQSVNTLRVTWTKPTNGKVDYYNVSITGAVSNTIQTTTTQVTVPGLLPGREYSVTVQTVSGSCNQTSAPVTEATYPTPPGNIIFTTITPKTLTFPWMEPVNMTGVNKSYNISYGIFSSSNITVTSSTTNVTTLQNLISGTNYSISVVTVGVRGYGSSPLTTSVYTRDTEEKEPMSIKSLSYTNVSSSSVSLTWSKPDEYQTSYSYRVQTNVSSSSSLISNTVVTSESATISGLTPGETYTFMVYTRAADGLTESDPVSVTTCTVPENAVNVSLINSQSVDTLRVTWTKPANGKVDYYNVSITGAVSNTIQTNTTQVTVPGLLPGREYSVTVQTVSGSCNQTSAPVTEATYPTPPQNIRVNNIGTNSLTLSWMEPLYMSGVNKSYNISYGIFSSSNITVTSSTTNVTTLQNLISGTSYFISVVTVGVRGYGSSLLTTSVYTKPMPIKSLNYTNVTPSSVSLTWSKPDEYQTSYTYRVQTNVSSSSSLISNTIVTSESATIMNLTPGETYTFMVYTRAADGLTESDPVSLSTCTVPGIVSGFSCSGQVSSPSLLFTWYCPVGSYTSFTFTAASSTSVTNNISVAMCSPGQQTYTMTGLNYNTAYTVTVITQSSCGKSSAAVQQQCSTNITAPIAPSAVPIVTSPPSYNSFTFTFPDFDSTNGAIKAYAIIVSSVNVEGMNPTADDLVQTYSNFKSKSSDKYMAQITYKKARTSLRSAGAPTTTVTIGDNSGDVSGSPYQNGPVDSGSSYWVGIAGFTDLQLDDTGKISPKKSLYAFAPFAPAIKTPVNPGPIVGGVLGSILGVLVILLIGFFIWRTRRKGEKKAELPLSSQSTFQVMSTANFISHFQKQKADSNLGFSEEYGKLTYVGTRQTKFEAEKPENKEKNRYTNVLPYDASRVVLSGPGNLTEDYINANYIPGYSHPKEFIAAQGPLPNTLNDFWRMIWEQDVRAIVMLTKCVELGKVKCAEYWPQQSSRSFGNLSIFMTDENVQPDWTIRDFTVMNMQTRQSKQVRHFHFTAWPDHGVPKSTNDLIQFRNLVREYTANGHPVNSPIVVHCSAGVGRTGTFIGLDRVMKQIEAEDEVDVYGIVYDLRLHRGLMVQTESQYIFLNKCTLDHIMAQKETNPDLIYQNSPAIYQNFNYTSMKHSNF